jgi:hypothetical protein
MKDIEVPPDPFLLESMRAVGYSFETAVADVIDNSIAADAQTIHLLTSAKGSARVSIFDDGSGMDRATAIHAMKLAARSPREHRSATDLGRFGLGLKTASLSQCRRLTVATKQDGTVTLLQWDLDHVIETGRWLVRELVAKEARLLYGIELLDAIADGTLICWEQMDQMVLTEGEAQSDFDAAVMRVRDHCSLVFHRFVTGTDARQITMTINGNEFPAFDPFLTRNRATETRTEDLRLGSTAIPVTAYTLPFVGKLSAADRRLALAPGGFRDSQGFYIYRAGRLVIWGTWFRLNPKSEMGKLARVRVDVPTALDHLWVLDIKKSSASPPRELREALRTLAAEFISPSARVQRFRGRMQKDQDSLVRLWDVIVDRDTFRYELNRDHPVLRSFAQDLEPSDLATFEALIDAIEQTFPVLDAHNRLAADATVAETPDVLTAAVANGVRLRPMFEDTHKTLDSYISMFDSIEPYCQIEGFQGALRKALEAA